MRVLLTGATGYIGKRLLPILIRQGHQITCMVRDKERFILPDSFREQVDVIEVDLLDDSAVKKIPEDIDVAYYLVHSMSTHSDYAELEARSAENFRDRLAETHVEQLIYLSGIVNDDNLSEHLNSRKRVEQILSEGPYHLTTFRAGIIIGSGSASFEIIRDLVEKLPVMIAPRWLKSQCQPIGIRDVLEILVKAIHRPECYDASFDIGGSDVLSYKEMLLQMAQKRGLKRRIFTVPVMTPRLSSYWLYFVTSTSFRLAKALVDSMKINVVCADDSINDILDIRPVGYQEALDRTFQAIETDRIDSSWKDAFSSGDLDYKLSDFIRVPSYGCFKDVQKMPVVDREQTLNRIWSIGGHQGWYYGDWLWRLRGFLDKMVGGVGLRRGRTHPNIIHDGDAIDFWRVLFADREDGRLLLFAEMRLPGEAWLEFRIENQNLVQTATFRPKGLLGRLYWYSVLPFHGFIFKGMCRRLVA